MGSDRFSCPGKETPVGEFSAPLSPTESSESEASTSQKEIPHVRSQPSSLFEFQGNVRMNAGLATRRAHTRPSSLRKHVKRNLNRKIADSMFQGGFPCTPDKENTSCQMDISPHTESTSAQTTYEGGGVAAQHTNAPHIDLDAAKPTDHAQQAAAQYAYGSDRRPAIELTATTANFGFVNQDRKNDMKNQTFESYDHIIGQKISHASSQKRGKWKRVHKKEQEFERMETCDKVVDNFNFQAHPLGTHTDRVPGALNIQDQEGCVSATSSYVASPMDTTYYNKVSSARSVSVQGLKFLINERQENSKQTESSEASFNKSMASSLPRRSTEASVVKTATAEQVCEGWRLRLVLQIPHSPQKLNVQKC